MQMNLNFLNINSPEPMPVKSLTGLANSINSFYSKEVKQYKLTQKEKIYNAIQRLKNPSQSDINKVTNIPRHLIPDRIKALILEGKIIISGTKIDVHTKKEVMVYKVNEVRE